MRNQPCFGLLPISLNPWTKAASCLPAQPRGATSHRGTVRARKKPKLFSEKQMLDNGAEGWKMLLWEPVGTTPAIVIRKLHIGLGLPCLLIWQRPHGVKLPMNSLGLSSLTPTYPRSQGLQGFVQGPEIQRLNSREGWELRST